jgi:hypothetical protein
MATRCCELQAAVRLTVASVDVIRRAVAQARFRRFGVRQGPWSIAAQDLMVQDASLLQRSLTASLSLGLLGRATPLP